MGAFQIGRPPLNSPGGMLRRPALDLKPAFSLQMVRQMCVYAAVVGYQTHKLELEIDGEELFRVSSADGATGNSPALQWGGSAPPHPSEKSAFGLHGPEIPYWMGPWALWPLDPGWTWSYLGPK